jgi:hypothetical protein
VPDFQAQRISMISSPMLPPASSSGRPFNSVTKSGSSNAQQATKTSAFQLVFHRELRLERNAICMVGVKVRRPEGKRADVQNHCYDT